MKGKPMSRETAKETKSRKQADALEAIRCEIDEAERALALAGVEAEEAKEEFEKARRIEEKAHRRLAVAEAKARAILKTDER